MHQTPYIGKIIFSIDQDGVLCLKYHIPIVFVIQNFTQIYLKTIIMKLDHIL